MNINFEYYKIFYYVAKYGSLTKAARVLGNSQPNITRAMNCLENEIHCTLFIRTNRGVRLTPEGERLYARARQHFHRRQRNRTQHLPVGAAKNFSYDIPRYPS